MEGVYDFKEQERLITCPTPQGKIKTLNKKMKRNMKKKKKKRIKERDGDINNKWVGSCKYEKALYLSGVGCSTWDGGGAGQLIVRTVLNAITPGCLVKAEVTWGTQLGPWRTRLAHTVAWGGHDGFLLLKCNDSNLHVSKLWRTMSSLESQGLVH